MDADGEWLSLKLLLVKICTCIMILTLIYWRAACVFKSKHIHQAVTVQCSFTRCILLTFLISCTVHKPAIKETREASLTEMFQQIKKVHCMKELIICRLFLKFMIQVVCKAAYFVGQRTE